MLFSAINTVVNTVLLLIIFFYQRNRNRLLDERIESQGKLMEETKSVVMQQATALEGQGKVVETALKYSSAFDPDKFEDVVRREIKLEQAKEMEKLETQHRQEIAGVQQDIRSRYEEFERKWKEATVEIAVKVTSQVVDELFSPIVGQFALLLISQKREQRESIVLSLETQPSRELVTTLMSRIEADLSSKGVTLPA